MVLNRQAILDPVLSKPETIGEGVKLILPQNSIKTCLSAASTDRPSLQGVILDGDGDLLICGTNGQQLHAVWGGPTDLKDKLLIESSLARLVQQDYVLTIHENLIVAENSNSKFLLPRIAEKIPDVRNYIQKEFDEFCVVSAEPVIKAVKNLKGFHPDCYVLMDFKKDKLVLSVALSEGDEQFTVPCKSQVETQVKIKEGTLLGSLPYGGETLHFSHLNTPGLAIKNNNTTIALYGARLEQP